jgi:hypothetical protein
MSALCRSCSSARCAEVHEGRGRVVRRLHLRRDPAAQGAVPRQRVHGPAAAHHRVRGHADGGRSRLRDVGPRACVHPQAARQAFVRAERPLRRVGPSGGHSASVGVRARAHTHAHTRTHAFILSLSLTHTHTHMQRARMFSRLFLILALAVLSTCGVCCVARGTTTGGRRWTCSPRC